VTAGFGMLEIGATTRAPRLPSLLPAMSSAQHAYIIACCHVITSDYQGGTSTLKQSEVS